MLAPAGEVYQAGTLSGNPLAVAAGLATLRAARRARLRAPVGGHHERSPTGCAAAAEEASVPGPGAERPGPADACSSARRPVASFEDAQACDLEAHAAWCRELLARGVYPPPSQFEAWFPSLAHAEEQLERTLLGRRGGVRGLPERGRRVSGGRADARAAGALPRLRELLRERRRADGELLERGPRDGPAPDGAARPAALAAAGPRAAGPARGVRAAARGDLRGLPAALRPAPPAATLPRPTSACWRATGCTRSASRGWWSSATRTPSPSSPTRSRSARSRTARGAAELAEAVWEAGAPRRRLGLRAPSTAGPRRCCSDGLPEALEAMRTRCASVPAPR